LKASTIAVTASSGVAILEAGGWLKAYGAERGGNNRREYRANAHASHAGPSA
jgi:hypothetical protein